MIVFGAPVEPRSFRHHNIEPTKTRYTIITSIYRLARLSARYIRHSSTDTYYSITFAPFVYRGHNARYIRHSSTDTYYSITFAPFVYRGHNQFYHQNSFKVVHICTFTAEVIKLIHAWFARRSFIHLYNLGIGILLTNYPYNKQK